jgi:squamous cell carcinoma antigen recognized by T-cells 3
MADPVGEDGWLSLVDEASRTASDLEQRIGVVELYKRSIAAEPWSLKLWLAYCEWVWSLYTDCQTADAGWPEDEQVLGQELFSLDTALDVWQQGAQATQYRLNDSSELWNRWISIELEQLSKSPTRENVERVRKLFLDRLQIPQDGWDETSQMFSTFITKYDEASWERTMIQAAKLAEDAKNLYAKREKHEIELESARSTGDIDAEKAVMIDYLDWESKQARMKPKKGVLMSPLILVVALYERALASTLGSDPAIWQDYIVFLGQHTQAHLPTVLSVISRAIQHCPWSGTLWARYIITAESEKLSYSDIESIKHAATNTRDLDRDGMDGVVEVYIAWCGYLTRRASLPGASDEDIDVAEMGLHTALESVRDWGQRLHDKKDYKGDPEFRIERLMIQYLTQKGSVAEARGYWQRLVETHASSYDFWQRYYLWEMTVHVTNSPPTLATAVLNQAVHQQSLDWPEKVMEVYIQHCMVYADAKSLLTAMDTVHWLSKAVARRREKEAAEAAALYAQQQPATVELVDQSPGTSKRKREAALDEVDGTANKKVKNVEQEVDQEAQQEQHLKRDRENTTVLITNLPTQVTQTKVRQYFKEYGHINSVTVKIESDGQSSTALIEFRSNEDVQSALIRDGKYFGDKQIKVEAASGLTLYVTNYQPAADDAYIFDLFKNCGEVFSIRWPSLKYNTHRRFCYVTFRTQAAAAAATKMDGQVLPGGFRLSALYSDPARKKAREGAMAEGRELHVTSVDNSLAEEDLKIIFAKYGAVEAVRLLRTMGGESKGVAFIVFKKKEDATAALALDKTKLKSKIMTVETSTGKNFKPTATSKGVSASPAPDVDGNSVVSPSATPESLTNTHAQHGPPRTEISDRTIALMNIPDIVNDARIRAIAEPFGSIVKLVLRPDHQGAIVEYADTMSAGRAALGLENYDITPGRRLRTGGTNDLFREKGEVKIDRVQIGPGKKPPGNYIKPSAPVRRPGGGGRGGLGTKRGLGYTAAKPTGPPGSSAGVGGPNGNSNTDENVAPKSNADFKAMFLSGAK